MNTKMVADAGLSPQRSVEEGAEAIIPLAASRELEAVSGRFSTAGKRPAHPATYDVRERERLRALALELIWAIRWRHPFTNPRNRSRVTLQGFATESSLERYGVPQISSSITELRRRRYHGRRDDARSALHSSDVAHGFGAPARAVYLFRSDAAWCRSAWHVRLFRRSAGTS